MSATIAQMMSGERPPGHFQQRPMSFRDALRVQRMDVEEKSRHANLLQRIRLRNAEERRRVAALAPEALQAELDAREAALLEDIRRWGSE